MTPITQITHLDMETPYFKVGYHKGEMDFGVDARIYDLSYEQMKELREMLVVGIGTMEGMWRGAQERKNPVSTDKPMVA